MTATRIGSLLQYITILLLFLTLLPAYGSVLHVPDEFATIQSAINSSLPLDTILCAPGIYNESLVINQHPVTIGSHFLAMADSSLIVETILHADTTLQLRRGIQISGPLSDTVRVIGMTITGGYLDSDHGEWQSGGGVFATSATVVLRSNHILENVARFGGGVSCTNSVLLLRNNRIAYNTALSGGGGMSGSDSELYLYYNDFIQNENGGLSSGPSSGELIGNRFIGNHVLGTRGGVGVGGSSNSVENYQWIIRDNLFANHTAYNSAGLKVAAVGYVEIAGNRFEQNRAVYDEARISGYGGALGIEICEEVQIDSNIFLVNHADWCGGAVYLGSSGYVRYNKFIRNSDTVVSGVYVLGMNGDSVFVEFRRNLFQEQQISINPGIPGSSYRGAIEPNTRAWIDVAECDFITNEGPAISIANGGGRLITNNYWGHPSGPYQSAINPNGQGDTLVVHDFIPWSTEHFWAANVEPDTNLVDFGMVEQGETVSRTLLLTNTGVETLVVRGGLVLDPSFSLDIGADSLVLASEEEAEVTVRFVAGDSEAHLDTMRFDCNDPETFRETVELRANVTDASPNQPDRTDLPTRFELAPAQPNPFNPSTLIQLALPRSGPVRVVVLNLLGRRVALLQDGHLSAGFHRFNFDGTHHASGLYLIQATSPRYGTQLQKVMLLK